MENIIEGKKANVIWQDNEEKEIENVECFRSAAQLAEYVESKKDEMQEKGATKVVVKLHFAADEVPEGAAKELVIINEDIDKIVDKLKERIQGMEDVMNTLGMIVSRALEFSSLKGVMISGLFDEGPVGIGIISDARPITEDDIKLLGEIATSQAEQFKDKFRQNLNVRFPGDDAKDIVTPGDAGFQILT